MENRFNPDRYKTPYFNALLKYEPEDYEIQEKDSQIVNKGVYKKIQGKRFKDIKVIDARFLSGLIQELRNNPNCAYVYKDMEAIKSGKVPKWLRVVDKASNGNGLNEVIASRINNFMGSPTTYEELVMGDKGLPRVLSAYFIGDNEQFITLYHLGVNRPNRPINELEPQLRSDLTWHYKDGRLKESGLSDDKIKQVVDSVCDDYTYSYLIRKYLYGDTDFTTFNCGVLMDKETGIVKYAPNFDMEECNYILCAFNNNEHIKNGLKYVREHNYPIYKRFVSKLMDLRRVRLQTNKSELYDIIDRCASSQGGKNPNLKNIKTILKNNVNYTISLIKEIESEATMLNEEVSQV